MQGVPALWVPTHKEQPLAWAVLTANEAAKRLGIVRDTFQRNVAPHLKPYIFGALRWTYYKQSEVDRFAGPRPKENEGKDQ